MDRASDRGSGRADMNIEVILMLVIAYVLGRYQEFKRQGRREPGSR